ncbi:MAG: PIN domain-containing protein [Treponemataceae bacterium]|nr:PIN domain-containing protein [Treponemataceae bacterium]
MILLDTNVIIDLLNNEDDSRWNLLNQEDCVICGIVISELYSGIKSKKERTVYIRYCYMLCSSGFICILRGVNPRWIIRCFNNCLIFWHNYQQLFSS